MHDNVRTQKVLCKVLKWCKTQSLLCNLLEMKLQVVFPRLSIEFYTMKYANQFLRGLTECLEIEGLESPVINIAGRRSLT